MTCNKVVYEIQYNLCNTHVKNPNFIFTFVEAKLTITIQEWGSGVMLENAMKIQPLLYEFFSQI